MDINWLYEQAKQKGLDAIKSIKSSSTPQKQVPFSNVGVKPLYESALPTPRPVTQLQMSTVTTPAPQMSMVSRATVSVPLTQYGIEPLVKPLYEPIYKPLKVQAYPGAKPLTIKPIESKPFEFPKIEELPKISEIIFGDWAKQTNRNLEFQWNKLTTELIDSLKTNLLPAVINYTNVSRQVGPEITPLDIALAPEDKKEELKRKYGEQEKAKAQLGGQVVFATLQTAGVPGEVFNRAVIQPYRQNENLNAKEKETGVLATPEERYLASLGDLNQTKNTLTKTNLIQITNTMTEEEKAKAEENNRKYYFNEVEDTFYSLLDLDLILGLTAFGLEPIKKGATKLIAKGTVKSGEKTAVSSADDLLQAINKADKKEIERIIKRPLTAAEDLKIDTLNDLANSDFLSKELKDLRKTTFKGRVSEFVSDADKEIKRIFEERRTKSLLDAKNTEYDRSMAKIREEAAGVRSIKQRFGDFWLDLRRSYWNDKTFSYETIDRIVKEVGNLARSANPKYFADSLKKTAQQAETFLETNGYYRALETAVKEGKQVLTKGADVIDNFGNFLLARRKLALHDAGVQKLNDKQYKIYLDVFNERKDRYVEATKQFDDFINALVKKAESAGLLTPDEVKRFLETGDYAPFYRIFNEYTSAPRNALSKKKKDLAQQSVFRELSFDEGVIKNPLEAAELMTYSLIEQANRNIYTQKWGELIRQGLLKGSYIIRDAANVIKQQQISETLEEVNKARQKLTKVIKKTKGSLKQVTKEINALSRRGIQLSLKSKPGSIDPALKQTLLQKIKVLNKNREKLIKDLEKLNLKDLELQKDKAYFGYETGVPKPQLQDILDGKVVKKENLLLKLMFKTDTLVRTKAIKYLNKNYGLFFDKMTDKQLLSFFRNTNMDELETFINLAFDLKPKSYDSFIKKLSTAKGKEADVIRELNDAKNAAFENKIIEALYNKEISIIKNFSDLSDDLQKVLKNIDANKSNIYYNDLFNSLIRKSPEELISIKKKISKKEPILNDLIDTLLKQQEELDIKTGYAKQLKEESALIDELDANGQPFISWLNNGVREIAVVDKRLAEEFFEINNVTDEKLLKGVTDFFVNATKLWKAGTTTFIPDSRMAQIAKDATSIGFFFDGEVRNSLLNPILFMKSLKEDVVGKSPEYVRFIELGGGGSFNTSLGDSQTLKTFASKSAKEINYDTLSAKTFNAIDKLAGFDEVTWRYRIYNVVKEDLVKKGMDPVEAELEAIWQSNNVLPNYFQSGSASNVLELGLTYSKVKMQSAKVMLEMFKRNPAKATFRIVSKVAIPTTVITAWNMLDADRAKVYRDIPEEKKKKNIIIILPNPINPDGTYKNPITIPVEETIMGFANPFRRAAEETINAGDTQAISAYARAFLSPQSAQNVLESTTGVTVPIDERQARKDIGSSINPIFRGPLELGLNYEFFRERNIVPDDVKLRSSVNQWDENTSLLAKEISLKTNLSPMVIDWFIRTYAQGLSKYSQQPIEQAIKESKNDSSINIETKSPVENLINRFSLEVKPGAKDVQESYEILNKKKQEEADRNFLIKQAMSEGDLDKLKQMAPLLTEAQFNQLYTSMQKQAAQTTLTNTQKVLFNASESELKRIEKEKPELAGDISFVKNYKEEVSKLPKLDTTGFEFMPSESKGGYRKPSAIKFGGAGGIGLKPLKVSKPKRIAMPKPKKLKIKKAPKPKKVKVKKLKPIKRTRNI